MRNRGTIADMWARLALAAVAPVAVAAVALGCAPALPAPTATGRDVVRVTNGVGVDWDDIAFSPHLGRMLVSARGEGLAVVDPASLAVTRLAAAIDDAASAASFGDEIVALDRARGRLVALDPETGAENAAIDVDGSDYVRVRPEGDEVWVTRPFAGNVAVFHRTDSGFTAAGDVDAGGGPEGLAFTADGRRAFAQSLTGDFLALDTSGKKRAPVHSGTGCFGAHGIPAVDDAQGVAFGGCSGANLVSIGLDDGKKCDDFPLATGGET